MNPALSIRPYTEPDADALWALLEPVFRAGDTYTIEPDIPREDAIGYWTGPPHSTFIAEADQVLGTYYLRPNQRGGGAHVSNAGFITNTAAKGRGVARAMLAHAEAEALRQGFRAMQFNFVVATNVGALHIWRTSGYEEVGRLPGAFHHPTQGDVDAFVLYKTLSPEARNV